jgi:small neutral amino acid transporter SnatA (MarC family)
LIAGLAILVLRFIASWGGPFSNIFGRVGAETFARFMGLVLIPISLWATLNGIFTLLSVGVV